MEYEALYTALPGNPVAAWTHLSHAREPARPDASAQEITKEVLDAEIAHSKAMTAYRIASMQQIYDADTSIDWRAALHQDLMQYAWDKLPSNLDKEFTAQARDARKKAKPNKMLYPAPPQRTILTGAPVAQPKRAAPKAAPKPVQDAQADDNVDVPQIDAMDDGADAQLDENGDPLPPVPDVPNAGADRAKAGKPVSGQPKASPQRNKNGNPANKAQEAKREIVVISSSDDEDTVPPSPPAQRKAGALKPGARVSTAPSETKAAAPSRSTQPPRGRADKGQEDGGRQRIRSRRTALLYDDEETTSDDTAPDPGEVAEAREKAERTVHPVSAPPPSKDRERTAKDSAGRTITTNDVRGAIRKLD